MELRYGVGEVEWGYWFVELSGVVVYWRWWFDGFYVVWIVK